MIKRQYYRPPKYSSPSAIISSGSSSTVPTTGNLGDWNIQVTQKDQLTQTIVFSQFKNNNWVKIFSIPVSNPIPFHQTSWPNPTTTTYFNHSTTVHR